MRKKKDFQTLLRTYKLVKELIEYIIHTKLLNVSYSGPIIDNVFADVIKFGKADWWKI